MSKIQKIYDYLKECNGFFFASCDGDKPRVRPFGFMMIFEDKLYFGMGTHKESYKQVKANPNVEICAMNPDGSFIRVKGVANFDMRPEVQAHMFEVSPSLRKIYNEESGLTQATFYLTDIVAETSKDNVFTPITDCTTLSPGQPCPGGFFFIPAECRPPARGAAPSGSAGSKQASPAFRRLRRRGLRPGLPPAPTLPTQKSRPGVEAPGRVLSL